MKSKRVLELKEYENRYKERRRELDETYVNHVEQLREEIEKAQLALQQYTEQEFVLYIKRASSRVYKVGGGGTPGRTAYIEFTNGCSLWISAYKKRTEGIAYLGFERGGRYIRMHMDQRRSALLEVELTDELINERLVHCTEVFADASRLLHDVVPRWFDAVLPNLDAELLMTTRVLRWISKQIGGQWPDVVVGHVVDKIQ